MTASEWSRYVRLFGPEGPGYSVFFSIVCIADGGIFIPIFNETRKEAAAMTMPKWEVNTIWSKVRGDVDIDDLIFNYEAYHSSEDDAGSDR